MSWLKALETVVRGKEVLDRAADVKRVCDIAQKLEKADPASLTKGDLGLDLKTVSSIADKLKRTSAVLDLALDAEREVPECDSGRAFDAFGKAIQKYGVGSKEAKAGRDGYLKVLAAYDKELQALVSQHEKIGTEFDARVSAAEQTVAYCDELEQTFLKLADLPPLAGTVVNATFFSLSRDCADLSVLARDIEKKLGQLRREHATYLKTLREQVDQNRLWIAWTEKDALKSDDAVKKNARSETPRR
jgi:hypothetical protein